MQPTASFASSRALAGAAFALALLGACRNGAATTNPPADKPAEPARAAAATGGLATPGGGGGGGGQLTPEQAQRLMPRADLSDLTPEQLATFHEVAGNTFDYAGCDSTLAACLRADVKDKHAPRMARLAAMLIKDGLSAGQVTDMLERYYFSFPNDKRVKLRTDDCAALGPESAPVQIVEYSDYQCPHCARAASFLHKLIDEAGGAARLCSKYYPLPQHGRAAIAAAVAEYARKKGKFWPLSDLLFEHQEELSDAQLKDYAKQAGLNGDEMLQQAYAGKFQPIIDAHMAEANAVALKATPSFYFNGRFFILPARADYMLFSIQDELEWSKHSGWEKE